MNGDVVLKNERPAKVAKPFGPEELKNCTQKPTQTPVVPSVACEVVPIPEDVKSPKQTKSESGTPDGKHPNDAPSEDVDPLSIDTQYSESPTSKSSHSGGTLSNDISTEEVVGLDEDVPPGDDDVDPANCRCCQILREYQRPLVAYVNMTNTDIQCDRLFYKFKLTDPPSIPPPSTAPSFRTPRRLLDRFEESRFWDILGLNHKWYSKLQANLKKINEKKLVYPKCIYRLHNTRHFAVPLDKKNNLKKEDVLKLNYECDKKLVKKNQAFECSWEECPHSFRDPQDMRIHYMFDHESKKLFCCGKRYENYESFLRHYVDSPSSQRHATWSCHECWGCHQKFAVPEDYYEHANDCSEQINPFKCPDPLCPMKYENMMDAVEHFFKWHNPSGVIYINDAVYFSIEDMRRDCQIHEETQIYLNYPMRAAYRCEPCRAEFNAEKYLLEHLAVHVKKPHLWLPTKMMICLTCRKKSCNFLRERVMEVIPKLIEVGTNLPLHHPKTRHPMLLIFRCFLTKEFAQVMNMILAKLLADRARAEQYGELQSEYPDHPPVEDWRILEIIDSMYFLFTTQYDKEEKKTAELARKVVIEGPTQKKNGKNKKK